MKTYIIETKAKSKTDLLYAISEFAEKQKITTSVNRLLKAFNDREQEFSTAFEKGIAIPHARIKEIQESAIIIARNKIDITDWKSLDEKPTNCAIALLIKGDESAANEHMEVLSRISGMLLYDENIEIFKKGDLSKVEKLINKEETEKNVGNFDKYDFVAVTSCPTGVAHTNMAAEALEKFAKENNLKVKVERQAAQGVVNQITEEDMEKTDCVILAIGRAIDGIERFNGKRLLQVGVSAPLKDSKKLWQDVQKAERYISRTKSSGSSNGGSQTKGSKVGKVSIMSAIMTGLSYMIPIVIVGGILLAFGLGIGRIAVGGDVTEKWAAGSIFKNGHKLVSGVAADDAIIGTYIHGGTIWFVLFSVGVVGINLASVVLGGFIAQAIGGRYALAPALIVSALCQSVGTVGAAQNLFFNYESGQFGLDHNANLSFFGAIVAGFLFGYAAKYWSIYVSPRLPKWLKTVEPIIIVPITFVFIGWFLFAFFLYLPLYWLSIGLQKAATELIESNTMWVVGMIGGGMLCFDMGGPVNKIAFGLGTTFLAADHPQPEVMGAIAAAGSVAPAGMAIGWLIGGKLFRIEKLRTDSMLRESFAPACFMALVGISEGAIPFAIRNPKTAIFSNVIGGMLAGALSGAFLITDSAAHTGPIVWVLGAVGKNGTTDYLYGLLYIMSWLAGTALTALVFAGLELWFDKRKKAGKEEISFDWIKKFKKQSNVQKISRVKPEWKGYAWKRLRNR